MLGCVAQLLHTKLQRPLTDEEVAAYLDRVLATPLGRSAVESLERRTEGWIAALQLATLSLRFAQDTDATLPALLSTDVTFTDLLADEVLLRRPVPGRQITASICRLINSVRRALRCYLPVETPVEHTHGF